MYRHVNKMYRYRKEALHVQVHNIYIYIDDQVVRIAVGLHPGVPLCHPHSCSLYGGHMDEFDTQPKLQNECRTSPMWGH